MEDEKVAKLLSDPMRRAILNLLREKALNETQLAKKLGLSDATVNYHLGLLKRSKLLVAAGEEVEGHGIVQKFYLPSSYLYLPDVEKISRGVARYYFPQNLERVRGALSSGLQDKDLDALTGLQMDDLGERFAVVLVKTAKEYTNHETEPGSGERLVHEIYAKAFDRLMKHG